MITKMQRGSRVRGLVEYLFGPGRAEEHTNQRIVAAWEPAWVGVRHPDEVSRALLTAEAEAPLSRLPEAAKPADHVYHVSISNHGEDRNLSDDEWAEVAGAVAERLGFTETDTRPGVRWFAVHHGAASGDRDHIHFVATLVREDGTGVYPHKDKLALREVAAQMQGKLGLEVRTREPGAGQTGLSRRELETAATQTRSTTTGQDQGTTPGQDARQEQAGAVAPRVVTVNLPRRRLERIVRAAALAAGSEAEWLTGLAAQGVAVAPRWAPGGERVVGYRVSLRPGTTPGATTGGDGAGGAGTAEWFGGGKLAHDLTLPALRAGWDPATTGPGAGQPTELWRHAADPTATPARPAATVAAGSPRGRDGRDAATSMLSAYRPASRTLRGGDDADVARVARDTAGLLSAFAEAATDPAERERLAEAAIAMSRAGGTPHGQPRGRRGALAPSLAHVAATVLSAADGGAGGTAVLLAQAARLAATMAEVRAARAAAAARTAGSGAAPRSEAEWEEVAGLLSRYDTGSAPATTVTAPPAAPAPQRAPVAPAQREPFASRAERDAFYALPVAERIAELQRRAEANPPRRGGPARPGGDPGQGQDRGRDPDHGRGR